MKFEKRQRTKNNPVYMKFYTIYKGMISRCYNKNSTSYHNYGGRGVTVCEEWRNSFDKFAEDIDKITGYNLDLIMSGELQLDKDSIIEGNKVYCLENCCFLSRSDNSGNRQNNKKIILISPNGDYYETKNREKFCREHNLSPRNIYNVLNKKAKHYKGWQVFYKDSFNEDKVLKPQLILGISPDKKEYYFNNIKKFCQKHNLSAPNVSMVLSMKQKTHKGWIFKFVNKGYIIQ